MTLYKHFTSKDQLVSEVLRDRCGRWHQRFISNRKKMLPILFPLPPCLSSVANIKRFDIRDTVERSGKTPKERLLAIFDALEEWFKK